MQADESDIHGEVGRWTCCELFPGGQDVFVPWAERLHYVEMIQEYRLKEWNAQMDAVCKCVG